MCACVSLSDTEQRTEIEKRGREGGTGARAHTQRTYKRHKRHSHTNEEQPHTLTTREEERENKA